MTVDRLENRVSSSALYDGILTTKRDTILQCETLSKAAGMSEVFADFVEMEIKSIYKETTAKTTENENEKYMVH